MILKRAISILLISVLLMMQVAVFAEPSDWAVEFVENATIEGLIPETLNLDYQNNIKRFEYVLMALKVLDQNNIEVEIKDAEPFVDISTHPYKSEIIKAYNAGIVGGYEDKTFRPDQEISREEVAALVFNLVKTINDSTELPNTESLFSDMNQISEWARPYIEFNYSKSIISGIGKVEGLDTIDPQGKTTREQAITLLYKVSKDKILLAAYDYEALVTVDGNVTSNQVQEAAGTIGYSVMDKIVELQNQNVISISYIYDNAITFTLTDGTLITISGAEYQDNVDMFMTDTSNTVAIEIYKSLIDLKYPDNKFTVSLDVLINNLNEDVDYVFNDTIIDGASVTIYAIIEDDERTSVFSYKRKD